MNPSQLSPGGGTNNLNQLPSHSKPIGLVLAWAAHFCLLTLLTACSTNAAKRFSVGIYSVRSADDLPMLKEFGFDCVVGPAETSFLQAADLTGLKVLAQPRCNRDSNLDSAEARLAMRLEVKHPALWAWYLADEPDLRRVDPQIIAKTHLHWKGTGVRKPTVVVLNNARTAIDYKQSADILMIDRYPIPWLPLADFGKHLELMRTALGSRPWLAAIQTFDWDVYRDLLGLSISGRPPTETEMRCMTYLALAHGARGVFYYEFEGRWSMKKNPETWQALHRVVREVNVRRALFEADRKWWARRHVFGDHSTQFNEALDSSIQAVLLKIHHGSTEMPVGYYILAINTTRHTIDYQFTTPWPLPAGVNVFGEHRGLATNGDWMRDEFSPFAVHIYGPLLRETNRSITQRRRSGFKPALAP